MATVPAANALIAGVTKALRDANVPADDAEAVSEVVFEYLSRPRTRPQLIVFTAELAAMGLDRELRTETGESGHG